MQFPAGSIVIRLGDDGVPVMDPVTPHLRADLWSHWAARWTPRLPRWPPADLTRLQDRLDAELRASMRAVCASGFAVDSFYASVAARSPKHPDHDKWRKPGPDGRKMSRVKQVFGTLHYDLKIRPQAAKRFRHWIGELFRFRGWAVHADAKFQAAVYREDLDRGVDWHYAAFRSANAVGAVLNTLTMLYSLVLVLDRGSDDLREWQPYALESVEAVMAYYEAQDHEGLPSIARPAAEPAAEGGRG